MANAGDCYVVELKAAHLGWGTYRHTVSRPPIQGECYLPIPRKFAIAYNILNSNGTHGKDVFGENLFNCSSKDGSFIAVLKSQGCSQEGDPYAKQFSVNNDLKALKIWYDSISASVGDLIQVTWISTTEIIIDRF